MPDVKPRAPSPPRAAARVGGRIPPAVLPGVDGGSIALRRGAGPAFVLVRLHSSSCRGCVDYVERLDAGLPAAIRAWGGRVIAFSPGEPEADRGASLSSGRVVRVAVDPRGVLPPLPSGGAGVVVADRYGEIFDVTDAGESHGLPAPRELEEWLRFLATQCPE